MTTLNPMPLVLFADEDQHLTQQLEQIFQREGFRMESVADGNETLARARELTPALVILGADLPGHGGLEVLRQLRENERYLPTFRQSLSVRNHCDALPMLAAVLVLVRTTG